MTNIKLFQDKKIRSAWNDGEEQWYFSVVDVVEALTDSPNPRQYWRKMKDRDLKEYEPYPFWVRLKLTAPDGKKRVTDCANIKGLFRIIQSIPSPKAEPFKLWLSQVGYERLLEIENPELAQERMKELYEKKGYPKNDLELIFTMLGERVTTEISQKEEPENFNESQKMARRGGRVAGIARKETEKELGRSVSTPKNYLPDQNTLELESND